MKALTNVYRFVNTSELLSDSSALPNRPEMLYIMNRDLLWLVQQDFDPSFIVNTFFSWLLFGDAHLQLMIMG